MKRSLQLALECGKTYMQVTYDLQIAKIAFKVQSTNNEELKFYLYTLEPFTSYLHILKLKEKLLMKVDCQIL